MNNGFDEPSIVEGVRRAVDPTPVIQNFARKASPELLLLALVLALEGVVLWKLSGAVSEQTAAVRELRATFETVLGHVDGWK